MPKLYRPHIPVETKCRVALRQLGELWPDLVIEEHRAKSSASYMAKVGVPPGRSLGRLLEQSLARLAELLGCNVSDLRLDHDPPLGARPRERKGLGKKTYYVPDANDPEHLFYRPHGPEFEGSHDIKTRVRGDHGQHPDRVLIKRERRRERAVQPVKRHVRVPAKNKVWRGRALQSPNQWPPKGSRRIANRRPPQ